MDELIRQLYLRQTRRSFLGAAARGIGSIALAAMVNPSLALGAASPGREPGVLPASKGIINPLNFAPKAKRIIHLYMAGGPSHLETFDYKPKLTAMTGKPMPDSFTKGQPIAQLQGKELRCLGPTYKFSKHGKNGQEISELFPHIAGIADDICIVRSMQTEAINHDPAHTFMNTGSLISGRPSMGSWLWYGIGSDAENLPGFVVLTSTGASGQQQPIAQRQWHSGFLPSKFQGVHFRSKGNAVHYIDNPPGVTANDTREIISAVEKLNRIRQDSTDDPEIATRISQYEMAFKMQTSVPDLMDLTQESKTTLDMYGTPGADGSFAANCLLARRLAERGVRFIQCYHRDWDHHGNIKNDIPIVAKEVDQAAAALIKDLKQRGMLDETLVLWGGEFGRTPMAQGDGRDHHIKGFSVWMAGGGIKPGITYGATDDLGYSAQENIVQVHDLHATMLRQLGIDHKKLTYKFQGRDFRLTDVSGNVVSAILA
ncbi:MAG: hypothetical protein QOF78_2239 [Phycisphaerales bacterium]|jgi:hypothetical protein|nr:hypothetical protein [Phycisphaerales bacterium]